MIKALGSAMFCLLLALATSCKDEPQHAAGPEMAAVDRSQLCKDGGAALNTTTNECVCEGPQKWNGIRCERTDVEAPATAAAQVAPTAAPQDGHVAPDGSHEGSGIQLREGHPEAPPAPPAVEPAPAHEASGDARLAAACRHAKAEWLEASSFCLCPGDTVLVGETCRKLPGRANDDVCLRAVHKGKWDAGACECDEGLVFSPSRGGCVARYKGDDTAVLRRTCESSMNRGKWDVVSGRCACPTGRVWAGETCQVQERLSSRDVCESDYNGGKWDYDRKTCRCAGGKVWYNQACLRAKAVPAQTICESELGGGKWNATVKRCICPRLGKWDDTAMACKEP